MDASKSCSSFRSIASLGFWCSGLCFTSGLPPRFSVAGCAISFSLPMCGGITAWRCLGSGPEQNLNGGRTFRRASIAATLAEVGTFLLPTHLPSTGHRADGENGQTGNWDRPNRNALFCHWQEDEHRAATPISLVQVVL